MAIVCRTRCRTWFSSVHLYARRKRKREKNKTGEHCVITMTMRGCTFFNYVFCVVKRRAADRLHEVGSSVWSTGTNMFSKFIFNGLILWSPWE